MEGAKQILSDESLLFAWLFIFNIRTWQNKKVATLQPCHFSLNVSWTLAVWEPMVPRAFQPPRRWLIYSLEPCPQDNYHTYRRCSKNICWMKKCNPVSYRRYGLRITLRWSKRSTTLGSFKNEVRSNTLRYN